MTIQITRWKPDTCECTIEYSWDDTVPQDQRAHALHRVVSKCKRHASFSDAEVWRRITDENPRKNLAIAAIEADYPGISEKVGWVYDDDHVLHLFVNTADITPGPLQNKLSVKFGDNRIIVE